MTKQKTFKLLHNCKRYEIYSMVKNLNIKNCSKLCKKDLIDKLYNDCKKKMGGSKASGYIQALIQGKALNPKMKDGKPIANTGKVVKFEIEKDTLFSKFILKKYGDEAYKKYIKDNKLSYSNYGNPPKDKQKFPMYKQPEGYFKKLEEGKKTKKLFKLGGSEQDFLEFLNAFKQAYETKIDENKNKPPLFTSAVGTEMFIYLYLLKKHKKDCVVLVEKKEDIYLGDNAKINRKWGLSKPTSLYKRMGKGNAGSKILRFSIGMCGAKKVIKICSIPAKNPTSFFNRLEQCGQDDKLVPMPLLLYPTAGSDSHANMLIINPKKKWVERYEPHGSGTRATAYDNNKINASLEKFFNVGGYTYIPTDETCPVKEGFQAGKHGWTKSKGHFSKDNIKIKEIGGYCLAYSFMLMDLRMSFQNLEHGKMLDRLMKNVSKSSGSMKKFLFDFLKFQQKEMYRFLKEEEKLQPTAEIYKKMVGYWGQIIKHKKLGQDGLDLLNRWREYYFKQLKEYAGKVPTKDMKLKIKPISPKIKEEKYRQKYIEKVRKMIKKRLGDKWNKTIKGFIHKPNTRIQDYPNYILLDKLLDDIIVFKDHTTPDYYTREKLSKKEKKLLGDLEVGKLYEPVAKARKHIYENKDINLKDLLQKYMEKKPINLVNIIDGSGPKKRRTTSSRPKTPPAEPDMDALIDAMANLNLGPQPAPALPALPAPALPAPAVPAPAVPAQPVPPVVPPLFVAPPPPPASTSSKGVHYHGGGVKKITIIPNNPEKRKEFFNDLRRMLKGGNNGFRHQESKESKEDEDIREGRVINRQMELSERRRELSERRRRRIREDEASMGSEEQTGTGKLRKTRLRRALESMGNGIGLLRKTRERRGGNGKPSGEASDVRQPKTGRLGQREPTAEEAQLLLDMRETDPVEQTDRVRLRAIRLAVEERLRRERGEGREGALLAHTLLARPAQKSRERTAKKTRKARQLERERQERERQENITRVVSSRVVGDLASRLGGDDGGDGGGDDVEMGEDYEGWGKKKDDDVDWEDLKWGTFSKAFKKFRNRVPDTPLKNLKQFAKYVIDNEEDASEKLVKKARFYVNVID